MGRIQGNNLLRNCKTRQKQMRYLLDNMTEPNFAMIESNDTLNGTFNLAPHDTLNTAGITWRILNCQNGRLKALLEFYCLQFVSIIKIPNMCKRLMTGQNSKTSNR